MVADNEMELLSDDELADVSGGWGQIEWEENGDWEYYFVCSACHETKEFITSGNLYKDLPRTIQGVFVCPKCGWSRNFKLKCGNGEVGAESWK